MNIIILVIILLVVMTTSEIADAILSNLPLVAVEEHEFYDNHYGFVTEELFWIFSSNTGLWKRKMHFRLVDYLQDKKLVSNWWRQHQDINNIVKTTYLSWPGKIRGIDTIPLGNNKVINWRTKTLTTRRPEDFHTYELSVKFNPDVEKFTRVDNKGFKEFLWRTLTSNYKQTYDNPIDPDLLSLIVAIFGSAVASNAKYSDANIRVVIITKDITYNGEAAIIYSNYLPSNKIFTEDEKSSFLNWILD